MIAYRARPTIGKQVRLSTCIFRRNCSTLLSAAELATERGLSLISSLDKIV